MHTNQHCACFFLLFQSFSSHVHKKHNTKYCKFIHLLHYLHNQPVCIIIHLFFNPFSLPIVHYFVIGSIVNTVQDSGGWCSPGGEPRAIDIVSEHTWAWPKLVGPLGLVLRLAGSTEVAAGRAIVLAAASAREFGVVGGLRRGFGECTGGRRADEPVGYSGAGAAGGWGQHDVGPHQPMLATLSSHLDSVACLQGEQWESQSADTDIYNGCVRVSWGRSWRDGLQVITSLGFKELLAGEHRLEFYFKALWIHTGNRDICGCVKSKRFHAGPECVRYSTCFQPAREETSEKGQLCETWKPA